MSMHLLALIGLKVDAVGRFRDCYVVKTNDKNNPYQIAMYTRNGGNNREEYMPDFTDNIYYLYDSECLKVVGGLRYSEGRNSVNYI